MIRMIIFISLSLIATTVYCQAQQDTLVTQTITYYTNHARAMYLVWDINGWSLPDKKYWKENSYLERNMVWSKMNGNKDSFSIAITLPVKTQLDFMFWVPIDDSGDSTNGWDTYGEQTYSSMFIENKRMNIDDSALWLPKKKEFDVLEHGWQFFVAASVVSLLLLVSFRKKAFAKLSFVAGLLLASMVLVTIIRMQMNGLMDQKQSLLFGAALPDLTWFISVAVFFILMILLLKKYKKITTALTIICSIVLMVLVLFSLLNIEIVKYLGRPLNYQWLYYSNFMTGADAKFALSENLTQELIVNISLFLLGILVFAVCFSFLPKRISNKANTGVAILLGVVLFAGYYQYKTINYEKGKIANPVYEIVSSTITAEKSNKLFSMEVSKETKEFIENYHSQKTTGSKDSTGAINNIVLFVLESTPSSLVSLYDSTYNVTPNIKRWKNISATYTNVYAHLPATVYSMGTMLAGVYPMITYKALIAEHPSNTIPSISSELKKQQWTSSLFFGADLAYSNIGTYVKKQGFDVAEDNTAIACKYSKFGETNTFLDQLDDRCLVDRYFQWSDSVGDKKKFSMLWTIQTHYHYLFKNRKVEYVKDNEDLNRYLNALKEDDAAFGMLMDGLKQRNMLNSTLVILTADHGEAFGTHDQIIHATKLYEENIHVPFILYNPRLGKGQMNDKISGLIDIAPTINHLLGFEKPAEWQGKSFLANTTAVNDRAFFICPFNDFLFGTRSGNWKYIYNAATNKGELYDLKADPKELNNVASQNPSVAKKEFEMIAGWVQYHNKKIKSLLK